MSRTTTPSSSPDAELRAFSIAESCERLGLGRSTVLRMIAAGQLRVFYPRGPGRGRPVRVSEAALREVFERDASVRAR